MKILFINGPNLNMLGSRDPAKYGTATLKDIEGEIGHLAEKLKVEIEFFQSICTGIASYKGSLILFRLFLFPRKLCNLDVAGKKQGVLLGTPILQL